MILLFSIALLLCLILLLRLPAFLALILTALFTGLYSNMAPADVLSSVQNGLGSTLGGLTLVLALGIMLGSILAETGAIQIISDRLLSLTPNAGLALLVTGFVVGLALFYNAGFVVLAPLVFSIAARAKQPLTPLAIAMAAPLSVTHGFLPPHPGATAVANALGADLGQTLLLGLAAGLPAIVIAGLVFPSRLKNITAKPPAVFSQQAIHAPAVLPGFTGSLLIALLPILFMATASVATLLLPPGDPRLPWIKFAGDPGVALLVAVLVALFFLSRHRFNPRAAALSSDQVISKSSEALGAAASLLLVTAAGGAFKQVLVDSGIGKWVADQFCGVEASPLLLGWSIATLLRIAIGSATIAGMTAAGIALPILQQSGASPELMTLAIGAGSLMCSHVNDTGFWMFKEYFGLSLGATFRSWTLMETLVGLSGLLSVLLLDYWI